MYLYCDSALQYVGLNVHCDTVNPCKNREVDGLVAALGRKLRECSSLKSMCSAGGGVAVGYCRCCPGQLMRRIVSSLIVTLWPELLRAVFFLCVW